MERQVIRSVTMRFRCGTCPMRTRCSCTGSSVNQRITWRSFANSKPSLWRLWLLQKEMGIRPSQELHLGKMARRIMGMPDHLTAWSFDHLVMRFGIHVENKLHETDDEGNPVWTLDKLLDIEPSAAELRQMTLDSLAMLDIEGRRTQWSGVVVDD